MHIAQAMVLHAVLGWRMERGTTRTFRVVRQAVAYKGEIDRDGETHSGGFAQGSSPRTWGR